jgi:hypothetical protein
MQPIPAGVHEQTKPPTNRILGCLKPNLVSRGAIVCRAAASDVDHKYDEDAGQRPTTEMG